MTTRAKKRKDAKAEEKPKPSENNKIKMTYGQLNGYMASKAFRGLTSAKDLSAKAKVKILKLTGRLRGALEPMEKVRVETLEKYCKKDKDGKAKLKEDGKSYDISKEDMNLFNEDIMGLFADDAEVPGEKITLKCDDFPSDLTVENMSTLSLAINFEE